MPNLIISIFFYIISSIIRAYPSMERFGLIGMIENKKHMEKIEKRSLRNQILKTIMAMDFIQFS